MKKLLTTLAAAIGLAASTFAARVNLATLTADTTLNNGDVAYGTLSRSVKISIDAGATVTISNATINIGGDSTTKWAGLTCNGNATIILEGNNTVYGPYQYPAIYVSPGVRLTIKGGGSLEATGGDQAAGIGGGNFNARLVTSILPDGNCGHIFIEGGDITAFGGAYAAGIGSGQSYSCGNIVISGGTVKATAGSSAAGIGAGSAGSCGSITITGGNVTATGAENGPGIGAYDSFRCGSVYIGEGIKMVRAVRNIKCSPRLLLGEDLIQNDSTKNGVRVLTITSRVVNFADITENTVIEDGRIITGTLGGNYKISIADGATVTLRDATINGVNSSSYKWAGLTCLGNATIILEGSNKVTGFYEDYPGIYVPVDKTLTIKGDGSLNASGSVGSQSKRWAPGIGGGYHISCGNIRIEGGTITAAGGSGAANIGGGSSANCGDITITKGVRGVTATQDANANCSIGSGYGGTVGTVTVGGIVGEISQNPYTYQPTRVNLAALTGDYTASDGDAMYGETTHTVTVPAGANVMINGIEVMGVRDGVLGYVKANTTIADGMVVTGTLSANVKVSIADGATVTLRDVTINGVNSPSYQWAGITCEGDATIILEGANTVRGFYMVYPGIFVPVGKTLTIKGDGTLDASSNGHAPGIGGGYNLSCGNIRIEGGTITAAGGSGAANIGGASSANCGSITITKGVTRVTATQDANANCSIGRGAGGTVGTVTVGGVVGEISQNPYTYQPDRVNLAAQTGDYTASDGDVMYGETTHTVTVPAGVNVMINGVEVVGVHDVVLDLGDVNADTTIADGAVVTGTLSANVKVSIADGATVTLRDVTINGVNDQSYEWAGITCEGDATIKLEGSNTVKGFHENYPGIYVPANKTLTINGSGVLNASSNGYAPGIGGAYNLSCGNIRIEGGKINAKGGRFSAGIGGGAYGDCGDITITEGATSVTAEKGAAGDFSIGRGYGGTCGTVTIGGVVGEISQNPYTYYGVLPAPAFAADGKAATTEFVKGENGKWTLTTFAEMSNDALGSGVANGQIKVYAAPTVEGLNNASPMTGGVTVKGKKSAVMTTIEVTPPGNPDSQFFKVKFGE